MEVAANKTGEWKMVDSPIVSLTQERLTTEIARLCRPDTS
jgi:hypothetical protein